MKKVTFATLKSYARKSRLSHKVVGEFSGMVDGMEWYKNPKWVPFTTLSDLDTFKVTKNWLSVLPSGNVKLTNCCFSVEFNISN